MATIDLHNESAYEFNDISSERWREYDFGDVDVRIDDPQWLAVSENGHRVLDGDGVSHYIGFGGFYFKWQAEPDAPHFVK